MKKVFLFVIISNFLISAGLLLSVYADGQHTHSYDAYGVCCEYGYHDPTRQINYEHETAQENVELWVPFDPISA